MTEKRVLDKDISQQGAESGKLEQGKAKEKTRKKVQIVFYHDAEKSFEKIRSLSGGKTDIEILKYALFTYHCVVKKLNKGASLLALQKLMDDVFYLEELSGFPIRLASGIIIDDKSRLRVVKISDKE